MCGKTVRLTSEPEGAAGAAGGSPLPPLPPMRPSPLPSGSGLGPQSKKASASTEAGGGILFTNDSMLMSQEMPSTAAIALQQNTRLSNNSTIEEGGNSGGGEEARDFFATDGLATLSDWEIRPEGESEGCRGKGLAGWIGGGGVVAVALGRMGSQAASCNA